eukprot:Pgem_evm1s1582
MSGTNVRMLSISLALAAATTSTYAVSSYSTNLFTDEYGLKGSTSDITIEQCKSKTISSKQGDLIQYIIDQKLFGDEGNCTVYASKTFEPNQHNLKHIPIILKNRNATQDSDAFVNVNWYALARFTTTIAYSDIDDCKRYCYNLKEKCSFFTYAALSGKYECSFYSPSTKEFSNLAYGGAYTESDFVTKREENEQCIDVSSQIQDGNCWNAMVWARDHGLRLHPEWYPKGLNSESTDAAFQSFLYLDKQCTVLPCADPKVKDNRRSAKDSSSDLSFADTHEIVRGRWFGT